MTTTDPRHRLAEIKARVDAATEGPWESDGEPNAGYWVMGADGRDLFTWDGSDIGLLITTEADAEFIAHARTDNPDMAAALTAVLDLHKDGWRTVSVPVFDEFDSPTQRQHLCMGCNNFYPCATVRALTDALGGDRG